MAVSFQSAQMRNIWLGSAISFATDYAIVSVVLTFLGLGVSAWGWGFLWTIGLEVFLVVYSLIGFTRRLAWYHLVEKEGRIRAVVSDFRRLRLPAPESFYNDSDEYLSRAAMSKEVPMEGRVLAAMLMGVLTSQRQVGPRSEAILTAMTIEAALQRLPPAEIPMTYESDEKPDRSTDGDFEFRFDIDPLKRD